VLHSLYPSFRKERERNEGTHKMGMVDRKRAGHPPTVLSRNFHNVIPIFPQPLQL
jgi:hypothetical protein